MHFNNTYRPVAGRGYGKFNKSIYFFIMEKFNKLSKTEMRKIAGGSPTYVTVSCYNGFFYLGDVCTGMIESDCGGALPPTLDAMCVSSYGPGAAADQSTCGIGTC